MEFRDLKKQYMLNKNNIDRAMGNVIDNAHFIMGRQVTELEELLADYVGVRHCITCANGTDALQLALMAWNIGENDAVFVPDFTFFSSGEVVSALGAVPVFVDVNKDTCNIDTVSLEKTIIKTLEDKKYTPKAIVAVDLFGQPADYPEIKKIADKYDLLVLEDGAQGFGGAIGESKSCSFGDIATTSFFPAKPLGCYGDGGAVFTDNDEWAMLIKSFRIHGKGISKYDNVRIGMNSRLDTIQAAVLLAKFPVFRDKELEECNRIAELYTEKLCGIVKTPVIKSGFYSSWAQYTIQLESEKQRNALQDYLKEKGIPTAIYYQKPMHKQAAFDVGIYEDDNYKNTDELCKTVLSLPMHPYLEAPDIDNVLNMVISFKSAK